MQEKLNEQTNWLLLLNYINHLSSYFSHLLFIGPISGPICAIDHRCVCVFAVVQQQQPQDTVPTAPSVTV